MTEENNDMKEVKCPSCGKTSLVLGGAGGEYICEECKAKLRRLMRKLKPKERQEKKEC